MLQGSSKSSSIGCEADGRRSSLLATSFLRSRRVKFGVTMLALGFFTVVMLHQPASLLVEARVGGEEGNDAAITPLFRKDFPNEKPRDDLGWIHDFAHDLRGKEDTSEKQRDRNVRVTKNDVSSNGKEIGRSSCDEAPFNEMAFCNMTLSIPERVEDLISRLSLEEKVGLLGASPDAEPCPLKDQGVPRLGIERYTYLVETNTGVASRCLDGHENKCSTTFASPALLAASFNRTVWYLKGGVISNEMRAYYHTKSFRGKKSTSPIGLHGYGPNVNLMRDPRWGRNSEVPSEDPFLAGEYAKHYTRGMQQRDSKGYLKMHASIKHYTAYSVETHRESFNGQIDTFNMHDSYLPAFEKGIVEGGSGGAMCSYASINGVPSCANEWLLQTKVRDEWGATNFLVSTDCGAVGHMVQSSGNHYASNVTDAIVKTVLAGTDLEMGDHLYQSDDALKQAVEEHYLNISESANIDVALRRVLYHRFDLGMFDPLNEQEYANQDFAGTINSTDHQTINSEAAEQGLVLLQNPEGILPLKPGSNILVVGPHAMSRHGLFEGYYGDFVCSDGSFDCVPTIGEQIQVFNSQTEEGGGGKTTILASENVTYTSEDIIQEATRLAATSDAVVACVGLDESIERETLDRPLNDIRLDRSQMALLNALRQVSSNVVVVLVNGGALAIEDLLASDNGKDKSTVLNQVAIVEAFYPGFVGAQTVAKALFGETNRWGLLPYSIYANGYTNELNFTDMSFTTPPGRTYRYYSGDNELFSFGYGLSYTTFDVLDCALSVVSEKSDIHIKCKVQNVGSRSGDAIVLLYHSVERIDNTDPVHPIPIKSLKDFSRHTLEPNELTYVNFVLSREQMSLITEDGTKTLYDDRPHTFWIQTHGGVVSSLTYRMWNKSSSAMTKY